MEKTRLWGFDKKPLALKAIIILLVLYGTIDIFSTLIYVFYFDYSGGGVFDINLSFGPILETLFSIIGFTLISIPAIISFIAAILIWRGKKLGYWISIILLISGFMIALSGLSYLFVNLPKLFTEDLLFLTKNSSGLTFIQKSGDFTSISTENLTVYRIILIKSFLKAFVEIIVFGFLSFIVINRKFYFKKK